MVKLSLLRRAWERGQVKLVTRTHSFENWYAYVYRSRDIIRRNWWKFGNPSTPNEQTADETAVADHVLGASLCLIPE